MIRPFTRNTVPRRYHYKPQAESEEANDLAKLRALFPDYHSGFKDIVVETAAADSKDEGGAEAVDNNDGGDGQVDSRVRALGHMSDKQLSSVVARHCRIFLSLSCRRRRSARALLASCPSPSSRPDGSRTLSGNRAEPGCTDAERLVAFGDSYRASVLLAEPTSRLPSCVVLSPSNSRLSSVGNERVSSPVLHMEEAFAGSHMLALADAARLCKSGRSLLEDAAVGPTDNEPASKRKGFKKTSSSVAGPRWVGEGAAGRKMLLVDPFVNFQLDPNIHETRLADGPLVAVLRRVAGLLEEFPGHGVLIQVSLIFSCKYYHFLLRCATMSLADAVYSRDVAHVLLYRAFFCHCFCPPACESGRPCPTHAVALAAGCGSYGRRAHAAESARLGAARSSWSQS